MSDDMAATVERVPAPATAPARPGAGRDRPAVQTRLHTRVRHGVRRPHNWFQLIRFGAVGATGYAVNLGVFAFCVHVASIDYRLSAVIAWIVSVLNNFWWNRHWTFGSAGAKEAHALHQGVRFFAVSLLSFGFTYAVLVGLVSGAGVSKVLAQAIAIAAGTPLNFIGQKLWSFKPRA
jgi:dolichol-phosphate mannosyltransferase